MYRVFTRERKKFLLPAMNEIWFSASQSGKYSVTLHFRSREVRFPVQYQKFLVECGKKSSGVREKCADTVDLFFSQLL
jgi:hypothetical protein